MYLNTMYKLTNTKLTHCPLFLQVLVVAVLFLSKLEIIQRILHGKNVTRK